MGNKVYLHIGNGGVTFEVFDDVREDGDRYGPTIRVSATHFGNKTNEMEVHITKPGLQALAEMFTKAASEDYSEEYVCAAEYEDRSKTSMKFCNVYETQDERTDDIVD